MENHIHINSALVFLYSKLMGKAHSKIPPSELQDLARRTYFDVEELKQWYTAFSRDCPTGRLTKDQFIELYKNFYETVDASKFAEHVFRTFDINHDNTIGMLCLVNLSLKNSFSNRRQ